MWRGPTERIKSSGGAPHVCGSASPDPLGWKMGWEDIMQALDGSRKSGPSVNVAYDSV